MTPDPWRELEAKLSRSGYEDERECAAEHEYTPDEIAANWCRVLTGRSTIPDPAYAQRPSPEGLHAQKWREAEYNLHAKQSGRGVFTYPNGSSIDTTPVPEGERLFSTQFDALDIAVNVDALQRSGPPRVPWRCRIGWHRWRRYPWAAREPSAPIRCTRCPQEKP